MASGPITSWQIEGERWKQWQISSSWALKSLWTVTAVIKLEYGCFLVGILCKARQRVTLPTKVQIAKAVVFPVVMCVCEDWTTKKAEHQRIDAF